MKPVPSAATTELASDSIIATSSNNNSNVSDSSSSVVFGKLRRSGSSISSVICGNIGSSSSTSGNCGNARSGSATSSQRSPGSGRNISTSDVFSSAALDGKVVDDELEELFRRNERTIVQIHRDLASVRNSDNDSPYPWDALPGAPTVACQNQQQQPAEPPPGEHEENEISGLVHRDIASSRDDFSSSPPPWDAPPRDANHRHGRQQPVASPPAAGAHEAEDEMNRRRPATRQKNASPGPEEDDESNSPRAEIEGRVVRRGFPPSLLIPPFPSSCGIEERKRNGATTRRGRRGQEKGFPQEKAVLKGKRPPQETRVVRKETGVRVPVQGMLSQRRGDSASTYCPPSVPELLVRLGVGGGGDGRLCGDTRRGGAGKERMVARGRQEGWGSGLDTVDPAHRGGFRITSRSPESKRARSQHDAVQGRITAVASKSHRLQEHRSQREGRQRAEATVTGRTTRSQHGKGGAGGEAK